ncbi:helix-turn-helix domain-containing protein [Sediminivirga luteola]|uniref:Transcriptional regulator n=1 Tax=Sediminivirga luteola TaxID=1774748 RepID=A0A8J2U167_9MICO|nr:helix-turn-helix domain-containing protein [Sediminivirga luteola]MCI2265999.1 helix-turn-helix domain-containing protein [Sediminivirga luteola]GGA28144.1 transcriptional regulator [Sediminivirga luteola]
MRPVHPRPEEAQPRIGARLRESRSAQGLSLSELATATGLTKGFLSRVERDETSPSVATLVQICQVLSLPIGDLFAEPEVQHLPLDAAPAINMGGREVEERLITPRGQERVQMIRSRMGPGASSGDRPYTVSCDLEVVHVLSGRITVRFPSSSHELNAGDTLSFPGREPHSWSVAEDAHAEVIWTLVPAAWSGTAV